MKLSYKIGKLAQPLTYQRMWRRFRRILYPISMAALLGDIDEDRFRHLRAQYGSLPPDAPAIWRHYAKYLDLETYLSINIRRAQDLNLHRVSPKEILDIGCGGGFFLFVAQAHGHGGLGLDTGDVPVFDGLVDLLGIERTIYAIEAFQPLPDLGRKFDLITAFAIAFHKHRDDLSCWGAEEWDFLIAELERHLKPGGRIYFELNATYGGEYYTADVLEVFLRHGAVVERERVLFPPKR